MLSNRVAQLKPSPTLSLMAKAKELAAQGKDVISLSVGEPDWDTLPSAKEGAVQAIQKGLTKYTPVNGLPELRKYISDGVNSHLKTSYSPNDVTVTTGGKFAIFSALQCLINPGDEVIIPAPYWVSYPTMVELAEGKPVCVTCDEHVNFKLTAELLSKAITKKTKLLILNSPSNPTGLMYHADELKKLAQVLMDHPQVMVISDDIYNELTFDGQLAPHLLQAAPQLKDRMIIINGASKAFSMTGWRIGWAVGPKTIVDAMTNYQSQSVSNASSISQWATVGALANGKNELKQAVAQLTARKKVAGDAFRTIPGITLAEPDGAFYFWPNIKNYFGKKYQNQLIKNSSDFSQLLLNEKMVVAVPGIEFGLDGYLRLSYVVSEQKFKEAVERIKQFVSEIR